MILGKYNQTKTVYFDLFQVDGVDFEPAASFATGDIKIMQDEGAEANTSNLPTDEGQGYSLVLTAAEMSAARIKIYVVDQTGTKVWLDASVHVETYGNSSAEHAFDLDTASVPQTADNDTLAAGATGFAAIDTAVDAIKAITDQFVFTVSNLVDTNVLAISDDTQAANNLELQYDGTGITGDSFPATQAQIGNVSSGSGGLSKIQDSFTNTAGGTETNTEADTETLNGASHTIDDNAGSIDFYYEFDVGVNGAATAMLWNGYIQSNGDTASPQMYNWAGAAFENVSAPISGANGTTITEMSFPAPSKYTGTGVNSGKVRFGFNSTDATAIATDRVLCVFSSVAQQALVFNEGVAQSGAANTIQLASGSVGTNNQFQRARVILSGGTGSGQEAIVTASTASTDTLTITPAWLTNPDATTEYLVIPGQVHTTVQNGGYDNARVYVDTLNGTAGTLKGVNGTSTKPSSTLADAFIIAAANNLTEFQITAGSTIVLPADSTNRAFFGSSYLVSLNSADIGGSTFFGSVLVTGIATSSGVSPGIFNCVIGTSTLPPCVISDSGVFGTMTMGSAGSFVLSNCAALAPTGLVIDYGSGLNASSVLVHEWGGGLLEIQNAGAGTGSYSFEMNGTGSLIVNANCSATTDVMLRGHISRNADVSGITYEESANVIAVIGLAGVGLTDLGGMSTIMQSEVNAEVDTALATTTYPEPGAIPAATASLKDKISYLCSLSRNKITQTATTSTLRNDADSGNIGTSTVSDDGTTATRGEWN